MSETLANYVDQEGACLEHVWGGVRVGEADRRGTYTLTPEGISVLGGRAPW